VRLNNGKNPEKSKRPTFEGGLGLTRNDFWVRVTGYWKVPSKKAPSTKLEVPNKKVPSPKKEFYFLNLKE
jgi:hypothetical protein